MWEEGFHHHKAPISHSCAQLIIHTPPSSPETEPISFYEISMSDEDQPVENLYRRTEDNAVARREIQCRRDSEASDTSTASNLAGRRRRNRGAKMAQLEAGDRSKRKIYPKVRTGCDTCKQRKIKCDETKPVCRNCLKSNRQCLGYHPPQAKLFEPASLCRTNTNTEEQLLTYFRDTVAHRLANYRPLQLSQNFWSGVVPSMSEDYPPIRHAMLALAATQQLYDKTYSIDSKQQDQIVCDPYLALEEYTAVLRTLNTGISAASISTNATIICCLLLSLCDLWHPGMPQSFEHVFGGLELCKIVKKISPTKSPLPETSDLQGDILVPAFEYLSDCALVSIDDMNEEQKDLLLEFEQSVDPMVPAFFVDIEDAVAHMDKTLRQIAKSRASSALEHDSGDFQRNHLVILGSAIQDTLELGSDERRIWRLLLAHHKMATILVEQGRNTDKTCSEQRKIFEAIILDIEEAMNEGDQVVLPGVVSLLFLAATRADDDDVQEHALQLLHRVQQAERLWTSCTAFQVARHVIDLKKRCDVHLQEILFDRVSNSIELEYRTEGIGGDNLERSKLVWHRENNEFGAIHTLESFSMPKRLVQVGGYSSLMLAFKLKDCHCFSEPMQ